MIKVIYTVTESRVLFVRNDHNDVLTAAQKAVERQTFKSGVNARVTAVSLCICDRCGGTDSLIGDGFICVSCNSR